MADDARFLRFADPRLDMNMAEVEQWAATRADDAGRLSRALLAAAREAEALRASNAALVAALECMACFKCGYPPASKNGGCPHCKNARTLMGGGK